MRGAEGSLLYNIIWATITAGTVPLHTHIIILQYIIYEEREKRTVQNEYVCNMYLGRGKRDEREEKKNIIDEGWLCGWKYNAHYYIIYNVYI